MLVLATSCAQPKPAVPSPAPSPKTFNIVGTVSVPNDGNGAGGGLGSACASKAGYDDIGPGAQVVVTDSAGAKVGIGALEGGQRDDRETGYAVYCQYLFKVLAVPDAPGLFSVHVGNTNRGDLTYKREDLEQLLDITIG